MQIVKPDAVSTTGYITRSGVATYYDSNGTLQTSSTGALRFGYDSYTKEFRGLIIENSSKNILPYSNDFTNAVWEKGNITTSVYSGQSPDSTTNARKIIPSTVSDAHYLDTMISGEPGISEYTFSIFAKAVEYHWCSVSLGGLIGTSIYGGRFEFNLLTGDVGQSSIFDQSADLKYDVEKLKNGWFRLSVSMQVPSAPDLILAGIQVLSNAAEAIFAGNASDSIAIYGAQLEPKRKVTSYIATSGAATSRSAEVITGSGLLYTSVTNPYSEWSSTSVSYTVGQYVVVGTYNNATAGISIDSSSSGTYRCLVNHTSSAGNGPLQSTTNWVRVGPTNQFAMFDNIVSSVTSATTEFTFVIKSTSIDTAAVLQAIASKISLSVSDASYSQQYLNNIVYSRTTQLSGSESIDWYSYFFFDEDTQKTQALYFDIPQVTNGIITVRVTSVGTASAGSVVSGQIKEIGQTQYGVSTGIIDYSKKQTDEFGNTTLVVRNYSKRMNAKVFLTNTNLNRVQRLLYSIRATPVLWIGSTDSTFEEPLVLLGYYKDFDTEIAYPAHSLCSLQVEGII